MFENIQQLDCTVGGVCDPFLVVQWVRGNVMEN